MSGIFSRAVEGQPLRIPAQAYNAAMDAAEHFATRGRPTGGGPIGGKGAAQSIIVQVYNASGRQIEAGYGCWIDERETGKVFDETRYDANSTTLKAVFRTGANTSNWNQRFGIAIEPIPPNEFGPVCEEGYCAAYVSEISGEASGNGEYAIPVVLPTHPTSSLSDDFKRDRCVLARTQTMGPAEIIHELGDEDDAQTTGSDSLYLVRLRRMNYVARAWSEDDLIGTVPFAYPKLNTSIYPDPVTYQTRGTNFPDDAGVNLYEGYSKQWTIATTTGPVVPSNQEIIVGSILRLPRAGLYEVNFTAIGRLAFTSPLTGIATNMVFNGGQTLNMDRVTARFAIQVVPIDEDGAELTSTDYFRMAWPPTVSGVPVNAINYVGAGSYGGIFHTLDLLRVKYSTGSYGYLGVSPQYGSFSGRCLLHVREQLRIGLRVRSLDNYASGVVPEFNLHVMGTFSATPALPDLFIPIGNTVIVGTAGASGTYNYTLANTGTTAPPGVTISSYAWKVWCPDGSTVTGSGSSLATTDWTAYGEGEYVARLIALYSDGSKGAEEFRFTLPNP